MRTTLIFSTLFAVTLFTGAALADRPHAVDRHRWHGDTVDKTHRTVVRQARPSAARQSATRTVVDRGASRMSCSEMGADCGVRRVTAHQRAASAHEGRVARAPASLDRILGNGRTSFNEAGEAQGMKKASVRRLWSHASPGASGGSPGRTASLSRQDQRAHGEMKASENRMVCNEANECTMSSKQAKKEWAYRSVKAGTWRGPEKAAPSRAERVLAEMRSARPSATTVQPPEKKMVVKED